MKLRDRAKKFLMFLAVPMATAGLMLGSAFFLPDRWGIWVALSIPIALITALVLIPGFTLPSDYLARWTKSHGIEITDANRQVVRRYLLHGRRIRTAGALSGYVGYSMYTMFTNKPPFGWITATFAGYLLGAAAAEVWALRPQPGPVRAASLTPRKLTDYVPRFAVIGMRAVPIAMVLALITYPLVRDRPVARGSIEVNLGSVIGWTIASVVLALFIEATARRVVRRPQPVTSAELVIVDDAIRSTSLHGLIGAGLALLLGSLARNFGELQSFFHPDWVQAPFFVVMVLSGVASPFAWLYLGIDQPWVVRRSRRSEPVAA